MKETMTPRGRHRTATLQTAPTSSTRKKQVEQKTKNIDIAFHKVLISVFSGYLRESDILDLT